jgi:hypothetical protein
MKNFIYTIAFLLFTILSFGQKANNDVYRINQEHISNVNKSGCINEHNYDKNVELRVKSKKIINDEIEVVFEYVEIPRGCYRGDSKSYYNRNRNYSSYVNQYTKGSCRTKSVDNYYVARSTNNESTYSAPANMVPSVSQYY